MLRGVLELSVKGAKAQSRALAQTNIMN